MPKEVAEEVAALKENEKTRRNWSADGVSGAVKQWNKKHPDCVVGYSSAQRWLTHYVNKKAYYQPQRRGAELHLTKEMEAEVLEAFGKVRGKSEACDAVLVSSVARGIVRKHLQGATLDTQGGADAYSANWGRSFLHRHRIAVYGATTTRTATPSEIVQFWMQPRSTLLMGWMKSVQRITSPLSVFPRGLRTHFNPRTSS